jgi:hypothetical protein
MPLIAAVRGRNVPVIQYLMALEADPMLHAFLQKKDGSYVIELPQTLQVKGNSLLKLHGMPRHYHSSESRQQSRVDDANRNMIHILHSNSLVK